MIRWTIPTGVLSQQATNIYFPPSQLFSPNISNFRGIPAMRCSHIPEDNYRVKSFPNSLGCKLASDNYTAKGNKPRNKHLEILRKAGHQDDNRNKHLYNRSDAIMYSLLHQTIKQPKTSSLVSFVKVFFLSLSPTFNL
jgi:hypothetical protein